ncbi:hypothetical protein M9H77_04260 [Catharanthus roseus]|uniref:Uncharacterized protein n=1 Tax=Catharanthus roseus TaxID=4058 RepID=A0ACC0CDK2_CATRO|nr:hypothetical protein M9H77_04260 [Catharanthus roseus]
MELRCFHEEARGNTEEPSAGTVVYPTTLSKETVSRNAIRQTFGKELKANAECLHIETSSSMPTDEQLMFEAAGGSNKGHVYGFGSQCLAINAERWGSSSSSSFILSVSSAAAGDAYIEREKKVWGYMQQA